MIPASDLTKFVIVSEPRTGSNYLVSCLRSHPDVFCHYEVFHQTKIHDADLPGWDPKRRDAEPATFLKVLFHHHETRNGARCIGFKIHLAQLPEALNLIIDDKSYRVILLRRKNIMAQYSSYKISHATQQWLAESPESIKQTRIRFHFVDFIDFCGRVDWRYTNFVKRLKKRGAPYLEVTYEELTEGNDLKRVFGFLDVDPNVETKSSLVRQNPVDIFSRFTNPMSARLGYGLWILSKPMLQWLSKHAKRSVLKKISAFLSRRTNRDAASASQPDASHKPRDSVH